jgi:hypothetical protein
MTKSTTAAIIGAGALALTVTVTRAAPAAGAAAAPLPTEGREALASAARPPLAGMGAAPRDDGSDSGDEGDGGGDDEGAEED